MSQDITLILAGATGLIGQATLKLAVANKKVKRLYSLSRRPLKSDHKKLTQWVSPALTFPDNQTIEGKLKIGIITLGSTLKKAGSKAALRAIDVELVIKVAKQMQQVGVEHIIVVSSIGASSKAFSHYLRCKGDMEEAVSNLKVAKISFMQPGPLKGLREQTRSDEKWLQRGLNIVNPLMSFGLTNYKLIASNDVANAILQLACMPNKSEDKRVKRYLRTEMLALIETNCNA
ncbi:nucleoside-diphosphate sugar epimerase [Psychromonas sp. psych-6C06]|uniref:NAD(P)H-binding protein n=1 Tax=Psychromonas sp. psych-6C06 TaxID=2058089 RepID=UPI000C3495C3|nr:NAD(P)H-binding protein [Psychromonas sp. psych-6C06]PKF63671.1 nucleoside-diphosphate sugar epimerase [Psychromonas sp. psych-6C06]